mgnify:CR=1 FL=1
MSYAIKIFEDHGMYEKAELLRYKEYDDVKIYKCNNYINHFYGHMFFKSELNLSKSIAYIDSKSYLPNSSKGVSSLFKK